MQGAGSSCPPASYLHHYPAAVSGAGAAPALPPPAASELVDLAASDLWISSRQLGTVHGCIVKIAVVVLGMTVPAAEDVATPALEAQQANLLVAAEAAAAIDLNRLCRLLLVCRLLSSGCSRLDRGWHSGHCLVLDRRGRRCCSGRCLCRLHRRAGDHSSLLLGHVGLVADRAEAIGGSRAKESAVTQAERRFGAGVLLSRRIHGVWVFSTKEVAKSADTEQIGRAHV